jgi:hypothetical protein
MQLAVIETLQSVAARLEAATARVTTPSVAFSKVSPRHFTGLLSERGIRTVAAPLPDLTEFSLPAPRAFVWPADPDENRSAPALKSLLEALVQSDRPVGEQRHFADIHSDRSRLYHCEQPGVGKFTGVPDLLILGDGIGPEDEILFSCDCIVDWKKPATFAGEKPLIARQGGVLALAAAGDELNGPPVFFTDMATGMRCFMLVDGTLWKFHRNHADLSLRDGIALIRYFLFHHGTVDDAQRGQLLRLRSRDGGAAAASLAPGGAAASSSAALGASTVEGGGAAGTPGGFSGSRRKAEAPSKKSSPGDPREFALDYACYLEVAVADFVRGIC